MSVKSLVAAVTNLGHWRRTRGAEKLLRTTDNAVQFAHTARIPVFVRRISPFGLGIEDYFVST
jgi:hypothetical protein